ncbi:uncharacterized protein LOC124931356 [Impatiens glandulifera]|uniref:uncharacterized protein LOC124931356 n=1 Tax=Impatiens glandulifera TaxID=253017 RepID=UPI001FB0CB4C|nr:uncharacterized protein LOC124931356 [Impatiens glandulifera]
MKKLVDFGRKALFYIRVLSGYEERQIRSHRLQLQKRLQEAEARKQALRGIPEKIILTEVRHMVEEMQKFKKKFEEMEVAIEEHLKPLDIEAQMIMKEQLEGEERNMKEMVKVMQSQAIMRQAEEERFAALKQKAEPNDASTENESVEVKK